MASPAKKLGRLATLPDVSRKVRPPASPPRPAPAGPWADVRFHVVSGKGGTGKSTVAGALALALATGGRKVLLMEVEGRQGIAQMFDVPPLPYAERHIAIAPDGGEVYALAVDPEDALMEYLEIFYNLRRAGGALKKLGAIDFATTIAPGVRDVLLTGKAMEAVKRTDEAGRPVYDAVVLDAPPTGRITRFLNVTSEVGSLAKVGPIKNQSDSVMGLIRSKQTAVHLVTLLEEMPVQETLDGIHELTEAKLPVGAVMVNMLREPRLPEPALQAAHAGTLSVDEVVDGLSKAALPKRLSLPKIATALVSEAHAHAERVLLERQERTRLDATDRPVYSLAELSGGIDLGGLYALARMLRLQGFSE